MVSGFRPWLWLPAKTAHDISQKFLPLYAKLLPNEDTPRFRPLQWRNLTFQNPLGIAGGVDKTGHTLPAWQKLGAGFLEVGTITPRPQAANPGTIIARDIARRALWNKMGFPNLGAAAAATQLQKLKLDVPLFINVGKNRDTSNADAAIDYRVCIEKLNPMADAFVINISSPNTAGLRELLQPKQFSPFIKEIFSGHLTRKPWLLKLSPDLTSEDLYSVLDQACSAGCSGFIVTNTKANGPDFFAAHEGGGVSGRPLRPFSEKFLELTAEYLTKASIQDKLIVSVGGIESAEDVIRRLNSGAHLVQVYSSLVFEGPHFFKKVVKELNWLSVEKSDQTGYQSSRGS